jgi:transcriptional regulator with XRE-family HTH domain
VAKLFGEYLREVRIRKKVFQADLAADLKVDRALISKWENEHKLPELADVENIASALSVDPQELVAILEESRRAQTDSMPPIVGKYELFQWSYLDRHIMKTNITVGKRGSKLSFEERVKTNYQEGTIRGSVSKILTNIFFYGRSDDHFKECEVMIVDMPRRRDAWLKGVVAGVSSDTYNFPSASRVVMHFLGEKDFTSPPRYQPIEQVRLPQELKDFLRAPPERGYPILTSRPRP